MNEQIDTHTLICYAQDDPRLPAAAIAAIEDPANTIYVSVASLWEIAIKSGLGKLTLGRPVADFFQENVDDNGFFILPIERAHLLAVHGLPLHHRDPFDRLIAAQSLTENMPLISGDTAFDAYRVVRLW